jgi:hypothetical protein
MEMGIPRNHMELIKPNCSAVRPNSSPNWGSMPARIEKENAVVITAKQLPLKSALLLIVSVIGFWFCEISLMGKIPVQLVIAIIQLKGVGRFISRLL